MAKTILIMLALASVTQAQRPGYAGSRPFGYPVIVTTTTAAPPASSTGGLGDRFGEVPVSTTTQRLPLEANGDANLVNQLMKLPVDQRPFWLLNWQALEEYRRQPQTHQIKDNSFLDFGSVGAGRLGDRSGADDDFFRRMYFSK
ncbi:uncharacterized protein LOC114360524 [Ostrinia furnacalis]|uniref:uncharacterized protein LOC114360524 n=1 Tax=Ostrinia furnacalis TaxID=93504 RepID=UPI0010409E8C|nr:uncharacterized protein LOC114360524 [Ostrinia furnacalis]